MIIEFLHLTSVLNVLPNCSVVKKENSLTDCCHMWVYHGYTRAKFTGHDSYVYIKCPFFILSAFISLSLKKMKMSVPFI